MIRIALMVSVVLYVLVGEMVGHNSTSAPDYSIYFAITLAAVITVALIVVMRRLLVLRAEGVPGTATGGRGRIGPLADGLHRYLCAERAVALFGLVLRILGFTLSHVATFYAVGLILMMFFGPRRPFHEIRLSEKLSGRGTCVDYRSQGTGRHASGGRDRAKND